MSLGMPSRTSPSNSGVVISVQISSFKAEHPFRPPEQALAGGRELHAAPVAGDELLAERLLEPLDLLADGGLGQVENAGRGGHSAGIHHCHEGPEKADIEIACHGRPQ